MRAILLLLLLAVPCYGAELLVSVRTHDIIEVFHDGKLSNYAHAGGRMYVVRLEGVAYEEARKYQDIVIDENGRDIYAHRYYWALSSMSEAEQNKLMADYWINLGAEATKYIKDKTVE